MNGAYARDVVRVAKQLAGKNALVIQGLPNAQRENAWPHCPGEFPGEC
jgi:hypothetical protein